MIARGLGYRGYICSSASCHFCCQGYHKQTTRVCSSLLLLLFVFALQIEFKIIIYLLWMANVIVVSMDTSSFKYIHGSFSTLSSRVPSHRPS